MANGRAKDRKNQKRKKQKRKKEKRKKEKRDHAEKCMTNPAESAPKNNKLLRGLNFRFGLTDSVLVRFGMKSENKGGMFISHNLPKGGLLKYLRMLQTLDHNREIGVDGALFVQLMKFAKTEAVERIVFGLGTFRYIVNKGEDIWYFAPIDKFGRSFLEKHGGDNKGQWLLGPDDEGLYLGMSSKCPLRITLQDWHRLLLEGVRRHFETQLPGRPLSYLWPLISKPENYELSRMVDGGYEHRHINGSSSIKTFEEIASELSSC